MTQVGNKSNIDEQLLNAVINSTTDVLSTMAFTQTVFKSVHTDSEFKPSGDISAIIGLIGDRGEEGIIALSFSSDLARTIVARLLGVQSSDIGEEDLSDGVRELVNMISGGIKAALSQTSNNVYKLTLPAVIRGREHEVVKPSINQNYLQMLFEAENEIFSVQVSIKPQS